MVRRTRLAAVLTLAMINVFTLAAGIVVARMLPPRLAALRVPTVAAGRVDGAGAVLAPGPAGGSLPTASGLRSALAGPLSAAALGPHVSAMVADPATGRVLLSQDGGRLLTPASTTKLVTSVAALAALGPDATFTTRVVHGATPDRVIVVGGGDPTLAVNQFPAQDYPQPATLASLAAQTARALKSQGRTTVSVGYDTSLYTGATMAPGWPRSYITTGNVTPIVSLEVDQGRLTRPAPRKTPTTRITSARAAPTPRAWRPPRSPPCWPRTAFASPDPRWRRPRPRTPRASPACPRRRFLPSWIRCSRRATT